MYRRPVSATVPRMGGGVIELLARSIEAGHRCDDLAAELADDYLEEVRRALEHGSPPQG